MCIRDSFKRRTVGDNNVETWGVASFMGRALARQGKLKEAEELQRNALAQLTRILGPVSYTHLDVYKRQPEHRAPA